MNTFFTSESVTCGHPDKVCDQIADRILDELLKQDSSSRSAIEVTCATDQVHIFGEVTTKAQVDYEAVARDVIAQIGYTAPGLGFDANDNLHIPFGVYRRLANEICEQKISRRG